MPTNIGRMVSYDSFPDAVSAGATIRLVRSPVNIVCYLVTFLPSVSP